MTTLLALWLVVTVVLPAPRAAAATAWSGQPVSSSQASSQACASLMFVGVRGSGEDAPYGTTVTRVRDALASRWSGKGTVRQVWLDYPAADPHTLADTSLTSLLLDSTMPATEYFDSARTGATRLATLLRAERRRCPNQSVLLAGYSQGAQSITEALANVDTSRLVGAILLGNPDHHPAQNVQELDGTAGLSSIGMSALLQYLRGQAKKAGTSREVQVKALIQTTVDLTQGSFDLAAMRTDMAAAHAEIPAAAQPATYSVCLADDIVCDAAPSIEAILTLQTTWQKAIDAGRTVHKRYTSATMSRTIDAVAARMNAAAAASPSPSPTPVAAPTGSTWGRWQFVAIGVALVVGIGGGVLVARRR